MKPEKIAQRIIDGEMLNAFLLKWPINQIQHIPIEIYTGVGDKETFCQYVETQTRPLGSIKGQNSVKFGIYKMKNKHVRPKDTDTDGTYTWATRFDPQRKRVIKDIYKQVINEIQNTANYAVEGKFEAIEDLPLGSIFKWKIAYLYSNNRLIPIFSKTNLLAIVNRLGMDANYHTPFYKMQEHLMATKPFDQTVVEYMRILFDKHRIKIEKAPQTGPKLKKRKAVSSKSTTAQERSGHAGYTASQFHNTIQTALYKQLCEKHGKQRVHMELNWVDIMVELEDRILLYEVKSERYASGCIINGLGQILGYAFNSTKYHKKKIELIIAGANDGFHSEDEVIQYIIKQIKLPIRYEKINYLPET